MDNKSPQQLDPKLKEAYDRVMGAVVNPGQQTPNQQQPQVQTQTPPATQPKKEEPAMVQVGGEQASTTPQQETQAQAPAAVIPEEKKAVGADKENKKKGISPAIIALGIVVILIVYALVWIMIFGIQLF